MGYIDVDYWIFVFKLTIELVQQPISYFKIYFIV